MLEVGNWEARIERRLGQAWVSVVDPDPHSTGSCNSPMHQAGQANLELSESYSDSQLDQINPGDRLTLVRSTVVERSVLWQGVIRSTSGPTLSASNYIGEGGLAQIFNPITDTEVGENVVDLAERIIQSAINRAPQFLGLRVLRLDPTTTKKVSSWSRDPDASEFIADSLSALADIGLIYASWGSGIWIGHVDELSPSSEIDQSDWVTIPTYSKILNPLASLFRLRQGLLTLEAASINPNLLIEREVIVTGLTPGQIKVEADRLLKSNERAAGILLSETSVLMPSAPSASALAPGSVHTLRLGSVSALQRLADVKYSWANGSESDGERSKGLGCSPTFISVKADPYRIDASSAQNLNLSIAERLAQRIRALESAERLLQLRQDSLLASAELN